MRQWRGIDRYRRDAMRRYVALEISICIQREYAMTTLDCCVQLESSTKFFYGAGSGMFREGTWRSLVPCS